MKFEIDDKTGMVENETTMDFIPTETTSDDNPISHPPITSHQLETILQAVKKTQEKIVNRQIQDIQDSKNMTISQPKFEINGSNIDLEGENISISVTDSEKDAHLTINCTLNHDKIEQNQKIVDKLVNFCNMVNMAEENSGTDNFINNIEHMHVASLTIQDLIKESTGKDIKDL